MKDKAAIFDAINTELEAERMEILLTRDHSGDGDFISACSIEEILSALGKLNLIS